MGRSNTCLVSALALIILFLIKQCSLISFLNLVGLTIICAYIHVIYKFSYWRRRNVPSDSPEFPFGYMRMILTRKKHYSSVYGNIYRRHPKEPYVGIYRFHWPALLIRDPNIMKAILTTNFEDFTSRGMLINPKIDPYTFSILSVDGNDPKWKVIRSKVDEAFSTGKVRTCMLDVMLKSADDLNSFLKKCFEAKTQVELKTISSKYALDVIGAAAFGVECKSFDDEYSPYKEISNQVLAPKSLINHIKMMTSFFVPELMEFTRRPFCERRVTEFFTHLYDSMAEQRRLEPVRRNDWMAGMLELLKKREEGDESNKTLTKEEHVGNMIAMMPAGYESSASLLSFAFYHLMMHPEIQEKAREEVKRVLDDHGGKFTYDAILEMKFLEAFIDETIRLYPPIPVLIRKCTRDCVLPCAPNGLVIKNETRFIFPTSAVLRDPSIYPDPENFDPERKLSRIGRHLLTILPFGCGPRCCPGRRYALIEGRVAIAKILTKFRLHPSESKSSVMELDAGSLAATSRFAQWVTLEQL